MDDTLARNLKFLRGVQPDLEKRLSTYRGGLRVRVFNSRRGDRTCQVKGEDGTWITLHSAYDPQKEAERIVESVDLEKPQILVLVGLGLGYVLSRLIENIQEDQPVIVLERSLEVFRAALSTLDFERVLCLPNIHFIVDRGQADAIDEVGRIQLKYSLKDLNLIEHLPSIRSFPSFYRPVLGELKKFGGSPLKRKVGHLSCRFRNDELTVLVFDSGYFVLRECVQAMRRLGNRVELIRVGEEEENFIESLLSKIALIRPDFVFTVNHLGFDEEGKLTELLTSLEIPFASWYVDSPSYILQNYGKNLSPFVHIFVWEKRYVEKIKNLGFKNVYYLPLATDPEVFRKIFFYSRRLDRYRCDMSFVGNSMVKAVDDWFGKFPNDEVTGKIGRLAVRMQKNSHRTPMEKILEEIEERHKLPLPFKDGRHLMDFESALVLKTTQEYRKELLEGLEPFKIHIYGDEGWFSLLGAKDNVCVFPRLDYYTQLPLLYNASKINLNATSFQMNSAVNQRVFDVAGCGAFLLTDHQGDMEELFDVGDEAICYDDKKELKYLVGFYLKHPKERETIARRAQRRTLEEHTYVHRMEKMISLLRREVKSCFN